MRTLLLAAALSAIVVGAETARAAYPLAAVPVSMTGAPVSDRQFDRDGLISPPMAIDPGMVLALPDNRGRLRIVQPPGTLDDGLHLK